MDFFPDYPPALTPEQSSHLKAAIREWTISHGLAVRPSTAVTASDEDGNLATAAPVTLFPSLLPMNCFHEALMIQTAYNEMYANIAQDEDWLGDVVKGLASIDDFIAKLWDIHEKVKREGYVQDLSLGLFRSDYMVHLDRTHEGSKPTIRQVEFNTIASSFGGLSSRATSLHRYLVQTAAYPQEAATLIRPDLLPTNASIEKLAGGLAAAHQAYGQPRSSQLTCILFITQPVERNVFDQKHIEYAIISYHRIKVFRLAFSDVLQHTHLGHDRTLFYTPPAFPDRTYEVTTIYLRAGYSPTEYEDTKFDAWETRLHMERSRAIKCPSVLTHLAGSKKVQQILATPNSPDLARFFPFEAMAARVRQTFAHMYPLDAESDEGKEGRRLATNSNTAKKFVLKPQREGGGNNIYRTAIPGFLESIPEEKWAAYILMEMIDPPAQRNVILRNGEIQEGGVICELGVFGTCLWRNGKGGKKAATRHESRPKNVAVDVDSEEAGIIANEEAGFLLRTKGDQSEEGGVAAGFGAIDSCCLIDI